MQLPLELLPGLDQRVYPGDVIQQVSAFEKIRLGQGVIQDNDNIRHQICQL